MIDLRLGRWTHEDLCLSFRRPCAVARIMRDDGRGNAGTRKRNTRASRLPGSGTVVTSNLYGILTHVLGRTRSFPLSTTEYMNK
jgi:hypothetical protein